MHIQDIYQLFCLHPSIQTDTRNLQPGDLFFALKGPKFNGNLFAMNALNAGAAYAIVDEDTGIDDKRLIRVNHVLETLQQLAKHHRSLFNIPFLAITGSNGKTTTKELIHQVLSTAYKTYTTRGNLNNHIGIPLTLLSVKKDAEIAVIEMGANHQKEIESYCTYTMPTHGIITNCGKAHLEGFGGEEGVRKGKGELFAYLKQHEGTVFIMNDYEYLKTMSEGIQTIHTYGTLHGEITGTPKQHSTFLSIDFNKGFSLKNITTRLIGDYNLPNVLAAVAVGKHFNIQDDKIKSALENYIPSNSRSQLIELASNKIILDAYNANPSSMKAAIENFAAMETGEKILMLGAMAELGEESIAEHQAIVAQINKYKWKAVVLVGGDFEKISNDYIYFPSAADAKEWLKKQSLRGVTILIKGSRSMQMEKVLEE